MSNPMRKQVLTFHANCLLGDNLHEMSNPVFWENEKYIIKLMYAKLAQGVVKVNIPEVTGYIIKQSIGHRIGTTSTGIGGGSCVSGEALGSSTSYSLDTSESDSVSESESGSSLFHSSSDLSKKQSMRKNELWMS